MMSYAKVGCDDHMTQKRRGQFQDGTVLGPTSSGESLSMIDSYLTIFIGAGKNLPTSPKLTIPKGLQVSRA